VRRKRRKGGRRRSREKEGRRKGKEWRRIRRRRKKWRGVGRGEVEDEGRKLYKHMLHKPKHGFNYLPSISGIVYLHDGTTMPLHYSKVFTVSIHIPQI